MSGGTGGLQAHDASGFFVLRTPLLPFTEVTAWGEGLEAPGHLEDGNLDAALAQDRSTLRRRLEEVVVSPEFRDALFVASPSLEAAIDQWRKDPDGERGSAAEQALVSYFVRAAARPTPFGLFAGCTTGRIEAATSLRLDGRRTYRRHTRLDMDYLWTLGAAVERDPELRAGLVFRPNSSLYEAGGRLLFAEAREGSGGRTYQLVAVEKTPYLVETIERARAGARLEELATPLVDEDVTRSDADDYLAELVDSQILVADVRPQLTGPPPTASLVESLSRTGATSGLAQQLREADTALGDIDRAGIGVPAERYRDAASLLDGLPATPEISRFVQVDLTKPAAGLTLGRDVVRDLASGVEILHAFTRYRPDEGLRRFREEFDQRYEGREMPLAQVLDEENGIGFERSTAASADAPLLQGLPLGHADEQPARWTARDTFLLERLAAALADGSREIPIGPADADAVRRSDVPPLPDAFEVLAELVAASEEAMARGEFHVVLSSASGPSGVRLTGRFCHADGVLEREARAHLRAEEAVRPDRLFAEVVHLPEGRVGNILSRPVLRDHEISYLGRSGAPADRQLGLSDLLVSVRGDRIVLRSSRLGREVVPRLTTAHEFRRGLGVYRFLCALQHQDVVPGILWDWGPLSSAPFLPRVVSGRVVLSRARWNLRDPDLAALRDSRGSGQFTAVQRLRQRHDMPRFVALADADNELVVDLDNVLSIEALGRRLGRRSAAGFVEVTGHESLPVTGPEGRYTHQVLVPFVRSAPEPAGAEAAPPVATTSARRFPPGSEWLYVKLFTGAATADEVLERIAGVVRSSLATGAADRWFFLRYGDPDWHLRLRLRGRPHLLLQQTVPLLHAVTAPLLEDGRLWRLQLDTYEREVERYGGDRGIELAERVFHADSDAALAAVRSLRGDLGADLRWRAAMLGIDLLLDDLGLSLEEKRGIARRARHGYGQEFGGGTAFSREVGLRYRRERTGLERLLARTEDPPPELAAAVGALHARSRELAAVVPEIRSLADRGGLSVDIPELAMSFAHMHVNRMLRSAPRVQELVLYEMLDRVYSSQAARRAR